MFLLDTHVILWCLTNDKKLPKYIFEKIINPDNKVFVSTVSAWEIVIKKSLGKLECPDDIESVIEENGFDWLSITVKDVLKIQELPDLHKDPFDRLLIAQALCSQLTLITSDEKICQYPGNYLKI